MPNLTRTTAVVAREPARAKPRPAESFYTGRITGSDLPMRLNITLTTDRMDGRGERIYLSMTDEDAERIARELLGLVERYRARCAREVPR